MRRKGIIPGAIWLAAILSFGAIARGQVPWAEKSCEFRRPATVAWDSDNAAGTEMAEVEFLTGGHTNADGGDVRVTTPDGREIPSRVLMVGPGDCVRVLFGLSAGVRQYEIYFGDAQAPPARDLESMPITCGLLLEMRAFNGQPIHTPTEIQSAWEGGGPIMGREMADLPFIAGNALGDQKGTISRYSGRLSVPSDGQYTFAATAGTYGALFLDGQPLFYVAGLTNFAEYQKSVNLSRGRHDLVFYQVFIDGYELLSVAWKPPGETDFKSITRDYFGVLSHGHPGELEARDGKLCADFSAEYQASTDFEGTIAHRYTFTAAGDDASAEWDFGDGQTATGPSIDHVFLGDGIYAVRIRQRGEEQTSRLAVHADWAHQMDPSIDPPAVQARIVADYDVEKIPAASLAVATQMEADCENWAAADRLASRLAREKSHGPPAGAATALKALGQIAAKQTDWRAAARVWDLVPDDSDLQPQAAVEEAELLTWTGGDFGRAAGRLEKLAAEKPDDAALQRAYAQALILNQNADQGAKILKALPIADDPRTRPAIDGAFARTVEFYIQQKDGESAEAAWEKWDEQDPAAFLQGYSVLLRTSILELKEKPGTAAEVAEAFALAMPDSAYSPELLDRASKLLADSDPAKSGQIRALLKQKYPEDPLSQN